MDSRFEAWMLACGNDPAATKSRISNLRRIESWYGDLDALDAEDGLASVLADLAYTASDARSGAANPSVIPIDGDIRNGLATLRSAVNKYLRFRQDVVQAALPDMSDDGVPVSAEPLAFGEARELTFSLEQDLQAALRKSIDQLEPGLMIIDGGGEYTVPSGRIDILAEDTSGAHVVVELKAVRATRDAVAQTLAYMGDISQQTTRDVRGVLVAPEFDAKAISAARVVPTLSLVVYSFTFTFAALD
jgi:hypothetical protein